MLSRNREQGRQNIFALAGWLFADLLLVLTLIFLLSSATWIPPTQALTPTAPPVVCGLDQLHPQDVIVSASDPIGLRNQSESAMSVFANDLQRAGVNLHSGREAGFIEVFGGSGDPSDGARFAQGAIKAMQQLAGRKTIVTGRTTFFRPLWNGALPGYRLEIDVLYFIVSKSCG